MLYSVVEREFEDIAIGLCSRPKPAPFWHFPEIVDFIGINTAISPRFKYVVDHFGVDTSYLMINLYLNSGNNRKLFIVKNFPLSRI